MHREAMPDRTEGDLLIPGGWQAWVPDFSADEQYLKALAEYFGSRQAAEEAVQTLCATEFKRRLGLAVLRRAKEYIEQNPDLVETRDGYRVPVGYDPERMQAAFAPNDNTGRAGKAFVQTMLAEMAEEARCPV